MNVAEAEIGGKRQKCVDGRELHALLGVGTEYRHWWPRNTDGTLTLNVDYVPVKKDRDARNAPDECATGKAADALESIEGSDFQPREFARLGRDVPGTDKQTDVELAINVDFEQVKTDLFDGDNSVASGGLRRRSNHNVAGNGRRDGLKTEGDWAISSEVPV